MNRDLAFDVEPAVWQRFPGLRLIVALAEGVDNAVRSPPAETLLTATQADLRAGWTHENPQSHPRIAAWRDAFKALGISTKKHASSIEALARRVLGGKDLPSINPLVDVYNAISLRHLVPAGGWDMDGLEGGLRLAFSVGGESFREMGSEAAIAVEPGELSYLAGDEVVTRHFVWRQSERAKVTPATRDVFLISEILPGIGDEVAAAVAGDLADQVRRMFGVTPRVRVLTEAGETPGGTIS